MHDQHDTPVAVPSSYGAPGSGPGVTDVPDLPETPIDDVDGPSADVPDEAAS